MNTLSLHWIWAIDDLFHFGSGLSHAGYADRVFSKQVLPDGRVVPLLEGDRVKGILRLSAEQLIHWLGAGSPEPDDLSYPTNAVIERLFAADESRLSYHPGPGRLLDAPSGAPRVVAATAIDSSTGVADQHTLRFTEAWEGGARFAITLTAEGGQWAPHPPSTPDSPDLLDAFLLLAAIVSASSAGAKTSSGFGGLRSESLSWNGNPVVASNLWTRPNLEALQKHAIAGKGKTRRNS